MNGDKIDVMNNEYDDKTDTWISAEGTAKAYDNNGHLGVRFSIFAPYGDYEVVETDYETYSLVYGCTKFFGRSDELIWVLTRAPTVDDSTLIHLQQVLEEQLPSFIPEIDFL